MNFFFRFFLIIIIQFTYFTSYIKILLDPFEHVLHYMQNRLKHTYKSIKDDYGSLYMVPLKMKIIQRQFSSTNKLFSTIPKMKLLLSISFID